MSRNKLHCPMCNERLDDKEIANYLLPNLRDQFAMAAIREYAMNKETYKENAKRAYKMADAMMEARK